MFKVGDVYYELCYEEEWDEEADDNILNNSKTELIGDITMVIKRISLDEVKTSYCVQCGKVSYEIPEDRIFKTGGIETCM